MKIEKTATVLKNFKKQEYFYNRAREGMFDLLKCMLDKGMFSTLFLPGYIGWTHKEGSGIFDPVCNLTEITVQYYKLTTELHIDIEDLKDRIKKTGNGAFAVLIVNYFGFVDTKIREITSIIRESSGWIIEDNAHGFFTYHLNGENDSDATFFSLHKMFPFERGGSLVIHNKHLNGLALTGSPNCSIECDPYKYDIRKIAQIRIENFLNLEEILGKGSNYKYFTVLKINDLTTNIPQSLPLRILTGDRNKIYQMMNSAGYGVVSLYHTLIDPLQNAEYQNSLDISKTILNLPVHQDVERGYYNDMVDMLVECCKVTS